MEIFTIFYRKKIVTHYYILGRRTKIARRISQSKWHELHDKPFVKVKAPLTIEN